MLLNVCAGFARAIMQSMKPTISIVGGEGKMGQLMKKVFTKHGIRVYIIGRTTKQKTRMLNSSHAIFFSVPLREFKTALHDLPKKPLYNKLLVDCSSLVLTNKKLLETYSKNVAFLHCLFGPDVDSLRDQRIIMSSQNNVPKIFHQLLAAMSSERAIITTATHDAHDKMMASVQALSHHSAIALAKTLQEIGATRKDLDDFSTLTFSLSTALIERIAEQPAELWAGIQFYNPLFAPILERYQKNIRALGRVVQQKDRKAFQNIFEEIRLFWHRKEPKTFFTALRNTKHQFDSARVAILGPAGTFSHEALMTLNPALKPEFFETIYEALVAVHSGALHRALLPLENSLEGTVRETIDGLYRYKNVKIIGDVALPIKQCIAGYNHQIAPREITHIYSHPQALSQCRKYLTTHYPHATHILTPSTAAAFKKIKDVARLDALAIGPAIAAKMYGLPVIAYNIQDKSNNKTLFVVISKKTKRASVILPYLFLAIHPRRDYPGLLYDVLGIFKQKGINLSKIESRPSQEKLGSYIFYFKADVASNDWRRNAIIQSLRRFGSVTLLSI